MRSAVLYMFFSFLFSCDPMGGFTSFLCALQFWIMTLIDSRESGTLRNGVVTFSRLIDVIYCFSSSFEFLSNEVSVLCCFFLICVWINIQHLFNTFQTPFKHINKLERHQHKRRGKTDINSCNLPLSPPSVTNLYSRNSCLKAAKIAAPLIVAEHGFR